MFEAQYVHYSDGANTVLYSPWYPKGGGNARFTLDLVQQQDADILVQVCTKTTEETGEGPNLVAMTPSTATSTMGQTTYKTTGDATILELVRYKFTVGPPDTETDGYVLFRMLAPVWFDDVKA